MSDRSRDHIHEDESTDPYGISLSREASKNSINNSTKTIIIEDLTCDPDDNDRAQRCWISLPGTNYSIKIGDKFDVMYYKTITDRVVNFAQQLLKRINPNINDLQDCCYVPVEKDGVWKYSVRMKSVMSPSCQVHHTGTDHWITSVQDTTDQIIIFDSSQIFSPNLTKSIQLQLFAIYDRGKRQIQIVHPHVQRQTNGVDCGIFAIAYATQFIFNQYIGYDLVEFDRSAMREHLLSCFQNQEITPFPKLKRKMRLKKTVSELESTKSFISR